MKKWFFPLENYEYSIPEGEHSGAFLRERKYHLHEGVENYKTTKREIGQKIISIIKEISSEK